MAVVVQTQMFKFTEDSCAKQSIHTNGSQNSKFLNVDIFTAQVAKMDNTRSLALTHLNII